MDEEIGSRLFEIAKRALTDRKTVVITAHACPGQWLEITQIEAIEASGAPALVRATLSGKLGSMIFPLASLSAIQVRDRAATTGFGVI